MFVKKRPSEYQNAIKTYLPTYIWDSSDSSDSCDSCDSSDSSDSSYQRVDDNFLSNILWLKFGDSNWFTKFVWLKLCD